MSVVTECKHHMPIDWCADCRPRRESAAHRRSDADEFTLVLKPNGVTPHKVHAVGCGQLHNHVDLSLGHQEWPRKSVTRAECQVNGYVAAQCCLAGPDMTW